MNRILVIAHDADLRRSLQFALEAEGYLVTAGASIGMHELPRQFDCTVVDHHATGSSQLAAIDFCETFAPVVLLANSRTHPLSAHAFRTVLKPLLGPALLAAIRDAIDARAFPK